MSSLPLLKGYVDILSVAKPHSGRDAHKEQIKVRILYCVVESLMSFLYNRAAESHEILSECSHQ